MSDSSHQDRRRHEGPHGLKESSSSLCESTKVEPNHSKWDQVCSLLTSLHLMTYRLHTRKLVLPTQTLAHSHLWSTTVEAWYVYDSSWQGRLLIFEGIRVAAHTTLICPYRSAGLNWPGHTLSKVVHCERWQAGSFIFTRSSSRPRGSKAPWLSWRNKNCQGATTSIVGDCLWGRVFLVIWQWGYHSKWLVIEATFNRFSSTSFYQPQQESQSRRTGLKQAFGSFSCPSKRFGLARRWTSQTWWRP